MTRTPTQTRAWPGLPWDDGITWFSRRVVEPDELPLSATWVAERVLRVADVFEESETIEAYIRAATQAAEDDTQRALAPQTWEMVLSGFPASGRIVLERPPLIAVESLTYYDADGAATQLAVSPAEFDLVPSGAYSKAEIHPMSDGTFPTSSGLPGSVVVRYRAGYENEDDQVYGLIKAGIALMVGELYKLRSLSVHAVHNSPSVLDLKRFWRPVGPGV